MKMRRVIEGYGCVVWNFDYTILEKYKWDETRDLFINGEHHDNFPFISLIDFIDKDWEMLVPTESGREEKDNPPYPYMILDIEENIDRKKILNHVINTFNRVFGQSAPEFIDEIMKMNPIFGKFLVIYYDG